MASNMKHQTLAPALDQKVSEILDSVRSVFVERGFDGASMQDLARGAKMSAGNFYRYFGSKAALVAAMVERDLETVRLEFKTIIASPNPRAALLETLERRLTGDHPSHQDPLWSEIEATAARRPEIGALLHSMELEVVGYLIEVMGRIANTTNEDATRRFSSHAGLLLMLVRGASLQFCGNTSPAMNLDPQKTTKLALRMADVILSDVADGASVQNLPKV